MSWSFRESCAALLAASALMAVSPALAAPGVPVTLGTGSTNAVVT